MENSSEIFSSLSMEFQLFSLLPSELQHEIWSYVAENWITEHLDSMRFWTTPAPNSKRIFLIRLDVEKRYNSEDSKGNIHYQDGCVLEFPSLLFVCTTARNIMYDCLLGFNSNELVPRGDDIQHFLRHQASQPNLFFAPQVFGWRIQDFRHEGLAVRVQEEKNRLEEMKEDLEEIRRKMSRRYLPGELKAEEDQEVEQRSEGYVRLPMLSIMGGRGPRLRELYPDDVEYRVND